MTMRSPYISATVKRCVLLVMIALSLTKAAVSQISPVDITVQLVPPYTSRIVDYVAPGNEKLRIISLQRDLSQASYRFFLRMEVSVNGQVLFRTNRNWQPTPITVAPGTPVILGGSDLQPYFDVNHLDFVNFNRDQFIANPNLPEGYTSICFTAYDYTRPDVAVSQTYCGNYFLALPEPPLLNYPACGMQVRALSPQQVIFSWVPMNMGNAVGQRTVYELSLYENRDNRNPNDIVQNVTPIYTNRTNATTVVYGPGEPPLQTGMNYVWRVQAVDEKGQQAFKNNGFTQPCHFTYTNDNTINWNNAVPLKIYAQAQTDKNAKIGWQTDKDIAYDKYTVYYRKKGNDNNWFNNTLTDTVFFVSNLEENTTYETRVQGIKGANPGVYSDIVSFTTLQKKAVDCKEGAGILATYNGRPYLKAMHNDIVHYGQFELQLDRVQALQPGYYKGTGTVTIPFMFGMTLSVSFNSIQIDDDMQVTAGEVIFDTEGVDKWLANTPTVNTVIKNLSDGIKALLNTTVKSDNKELEKLAEQVKQLAQQELPKVLIDSLNNALDNMKDAKTAYTEAKKEYDNATTPEAKQEAQNKMNEEEKKYNEGKQALAELEKRKEEMANNVTQYIVKAIKQLKTEVDVLQKNPTGNSATGNSTATSTTGDITVVILKTEILALETQDATSGISNLEDLSKEKLKVISGKYFALVNSLFSYYGDKQNPSFNNDNALQGKELVKYAIDQEQAKVPEKELVQQLHDKLQSILITISKQL